MLVLNSPASRKKSACLSAGIVGHGLQDTEQAFAQKPFTPLVLRRKVRELLERAG
jgi:hypothetical protein